ncbi:MAG: hypothetical protein JNK82_00215 [Myxococcaceae bacterium]|nr:hypothetical protein [Myxococcaceae bacterium]
MDIGWQTSGGYFAAMVHTLRELGRLEAVWQAAPAQVRELLDSPRRHAWWSGETSIDFARTLEQVGGRDLVVELGRRATPRALGRGFVPAVSTLITLTSGTPDALLARSGLLIAVLVKNVKTAWQPSGPQGGHFSARYPSANLPVYAAFWEGALELIFTISKTTGAIRLLEHFEGEYRFEVSWERMKR